MSGLDRPKSAAYHAGPWPIELEWTVRWDVRPRPIWDPAPWEGLDMIFRGVYASVVYEPRS